MYKAQRCTNIYLLGPNHQNHHINVCLEASLLALNPQPKATFSSLFTPDQATILIILYDSKSLDQFEESETVVEIIMYFWLSSSILGIYDGS